MAKYKILVKRSAEKELSQLPRSYLVPILKIISSLSENPGPAGSEKLSGEDKYRIRKGRYRIVYSVQDRDLIIWVVKISHRKQAYR
jgi:mRNA interferase RelE/StbE